ncbi:MAG: hypothetical protein KI790_12520 [Cyclobacteriaceae bacterium]|nr:hypothetical protein [Cyclobacteriaceae bacterium HetDA_MAG_MS6]
MRTLFFLFLASLVIFTSCEENSVGEDDSQTSNIPDISAFGIYLIQKDSFNQVFPPDASTIIVDEEPVISLTDIDYFDESSQALRLNKDFGGVDWTNDFYAVIENGQLLGLGSFYGPSCCFPVSDNLLLTFTSPIPFVGVSANQVEMFKSALPSDKIKSDLEVNITSVQNAGNDLIDFSFDITNNLDYDIYILDPEKVDDLDMISFDAIWDDCTLLCDVNPTIASNPASTNWTKSLYSLIGSGASKSFTIQSTPGPVEGLNHTVSIFYDNYATGFDEADLTGSEPVWLGVVSHTQQVTIEQ